MLGAVRTAFQATNSLLFCFTHNGQIVTHDFEKECGHRGGVYQGEELEMVSELRGWLQDSGDWTAKWLRVWDFYKQLNGESEDRPGTDLRFRDGMWDDDVLEMLCKVHAWLVRRGWSWEDEWLSVYEYLLKESGELEEFGDSEESGKREHSEWLHDAKSGQATSASPPTVTPPQDRFLRVSPSRTPEKVPRPLQKVQLAANKRLQAQLKKLKNQPKNEPVSQSDQSGKPKPSGTVPSKVSKPKTSSKKPLRKNNKSGPMQKAMAAFFQKAKATMSHREAQQAWMESSERECIVSSMSASERARRRF